MGNRLQKRLAKAIVEDAANAIPQTGGKLLEAAGYSRATITGHTGETLERKGVKEELEKMGFTTKKAKKTVAEIMNNKKVNPHTRLEAADKVFKVNGDYAPKKNINVNVEVEPDEKIKELTAKLNELYGGGGKQSDGRESSVMDNQAPNKE